MSHVHWTKLFLPTGENEHMPMNNPSTQIYQVKTIRLFWTLLCVIVMTVADVWSFLALASACMSVIAFVRLPGPWSRQGRERSSRCAFEKTVEWRTASLGSKLWHGHSHVHSAFHAHRQHHSGHDTVRCQLHEKGGESKLCFSLFLILTGKIENWKGVNTADVHIGWSKKC